LGTGSLAEHNNVVNKTILRISQSGLARVWRNETGKAIKLSYVKAIQKGELDLQDIMRGCFSFGLNGSADILGICINGKFLAIEIKTGNAKQSKDQKAFQKMVQRFNGIYILARDPDQALSILNQILD
jgi:hypothetical protein